MWQNCTLGKDLDDMCFFCNKRGHTTTYSMTPFLRSELGQMEFPSNQICRFLKSNLELGGK